MAESALVFSTHKQCAALLETVRSGRAHLPKFGRSRRLEAGSVVYDFDDPVHHLYLVNSGQVRASVLSAEGRELVTGIYGPGEMFGQFCLCQRRERNERAVVTEDAELVSLGVEDLLELAASPDGALAMLQLFCSRISALEEQVAQLAFAKVRTRLALLLLRLAESGERRADGAVRCDPSPTHEEMASRIGATREQVSSLLSQFRREGLIDYRRTGPLYIRPESLRAHIETL